MRQLAFDCLHEYPGLNDVELRHVGIEHHPLLAQREDAAADEGLQFPPIAEGCVARLT